MKIVPKGVSAEQFGKRMFKLAWDACGGPLGMGMLQDRGPGVSEDEVWGNVRRNADYPMNTNRANQVYGDYVFGRMMKFGFKLNENDLNIPEHEWRWDYQGFSGTGSRKFANLDALVAATVESFRKENVEVELEISEKEVAAD